MILFRIQYFLGFLTLLLFSDGHAVADQGSIETADQEAPGKLRPFVEVLAAGPNQVCVYATELSNDRFKRYLQESGENRGLIDHVLRRWRLFNEQPHMEVIGPIDATRLLESLAASPAKQGKIDSTTFSLMASGSFFLGYSFFSNVYSGEVVQSLLKGLKGAIDAKQVTANAAAPVVRKSNRTLASIGRFLEKATDIGVFQREWKQNLEREFGESPLRTIRRRTIADLNKLYTLVNINRWGKSLQIYAGAAETAQLDDIKRLKEYNFQKALYRVVGKFTKDIVFFTKLIGEDAKTRRLELKLASYTLLTMAAVKHSLPKYLFSDDDIERFLSTQDITQDQKKVERFVNIARTVPEEYTDHSCAGPQEVLERLENKDKSDYKYDLEMDPKDINRS